MGNIQAYEYSFHAYLPTLNELIPEGADREKIFAEHGVIAIRYSEFACRICLAKSLRKTVENKVVREPTHTKDDVERFLAFHQQYFPDQLISPYSRFQE